ncbi:MAG: sigma-70 family RNA polymerase sigma factor [Betaproteobacteria bacterium]|nr:sigma-70 family RNA polymerase sigma factor [Betaproteobacteria bacterium]
MHYVTVAKNFVPGRMTIHSDLDADRTLIEAVIASDPDSIDRFVRQYVRFIYCSACRDARLGHHDAVDVTRRVFVRLRENDCWRLRLWHGTAFERFLREIVNNEALSFARGRPRPAHDLFPANDAEREDASASIPPSDRDPQADPLLAELRDFIVQSYDKLPPRQQEAIAGRYQYALDQRSIAAIFGLSQASAAQRVSRGTQALRDCLSSRLGERPWLLA